MTDSEIDSVWDYLCEMFPKTSAVGAGEVRIWRKMLREYRSVDAVRAAIDQCRRTSKYRIASIADIEDAIRAELAERRRQQPTGPAKKERAIDWLRGRYIGMGSLSDAELICHHAELCWIDVRDWLPADTFSANAGAMPERPDDQSIAFTRAHIYSDCRMSLLDLGVELAECVRLSRAAVGLQDGERLVQHVELVKAVEATKETAA